MLLVAFPFPRRGLQLDAGAAAPPRREVSGNKESEYVGTLFSEAFPVPGKMENVRAPNRRNPLTPIVRATAETH